MKVRSHFQRELFCHIEVEPLILVTLLVVAGDEKIFIVLYIEDQITFEADKQLGIGEASLSFDLDNDAFGAVLFEVVDDVHRHFA